VDDGHLNDAGQQAKDGAFDLDVLMSHQDGKADEKESNEKEREAAANGLVLFGQCAVQTESDAQRCADIAEHDQRLSVTRGGKAP
jgi:hypothetical protein